MLIDGVPLGHLDLVIRPIEQKTPFQADSTVLGQLIIAKSGLGVFEDDTQQKTDFVATPDDTMWYATGDVVECTRDGIRVLGRSGRVIKGRTGEWFRLDSLALQLIQSEQVPPFVVNSEGTSLSLFWSSFVQDRVKKQRIISQLEKKTGLRVTKEDLVYKHEVFQETLFENLKNSHYKSLMDMLRGHLSQGN